LLFFAVLIPNLLIAQVSVTATSGTLSGTYTTLKGAFDAINSGVHKGDIVIDITASTSETAPAVLNSGDADPAAYSSIMIEPVVDGVSISGAPGAGRGVIELNGADNVLIFGDNPNTVGSNRDLTITNTSLASVTASSVIRIATRPSSAATADNNFILNCILNGNVTAGNASGIVATTSSSNLSFGIYCGGNAGTTSVTAPTAITSATADVAAAGTTIDNLVIDNNQINRCGRAIVFNGATTGTSTSLTITNNSIGGSGVLGTYPYTAPATTVYTKGIWVAGTGAVTVSGDTLQNILSYVGTSITGIELAGAIGAGLIDISANTINAVVNNSTSSDAFGILVSAAANRFTVTGNTIDIVQNSAATPVAGIRIATTGGQATINQNKISRIFSRNTGGYGAYGIHLSSAANAAEINNNFIYDVMNSGAASFTPADNASGIYLASGSNHKIYHNSVHLSGVSAATSTNLITCLSVISNAITGLDIRNNIFSNVVTGGSAFDAHVCLYFPFAASAGLNYTINNNAYYTGSIAGKSGIAYAGSSSYLAANVYDVAGFNAAATTPATNFRNYSSSLGVGSNDFASFGSTAAAPFTSFTNLHIPAATLTRLESGGVPVSISVDIDGAGRSGSAPDIGADEFVGTPQDLTPPLITFTPLTGTCTVGNRTLTTSITDASGVPTSGVGLPKLYWFINGVPQAAVTAVFGGGSTYTFTFGAGAVVPDVVTYYIVAQDNAATPNVTAQSSVGAGSFTANPPAATTAPTTMDSYGVQSNLAPGTYTVGVSGVYPTLTAAIAVYNNSCLSGPVIFSLIDASYPSETFPIVIGNPVASAANTLTIRPAALMSPAITGSSSVALIKLNGADYVTIDGSNNGSSTQNLTLTNTDAGTSSVVIWVASASVSNGATHNTIKNCIISGNTNTTTFGGIVSSSGATIGAVAETANSNNTYLNNNISTSVYGLAVVGPSAGEAATIIRNNKIGSAVAANKISFIGVFVSNQTGVSVDNNTIAGITSTQGSNTNVTGGITVRGSIAGGNIYNNVINDVKNTAAAAWTAHGITLQASTLTSNLNVYNNFIYDITGDGYTPNLTDNGHGIGILGGGGYNIYYNSINLNTDQPTAGNSAAIFIDNRPTGFSVAGPTPVNLNIRNNIFSNPQTSASGTRYAIYSSVPASSFTSINYNDYYCTGLLGFLGTTTANLTLWQAATGQDGNSVATDPLFQTPTNLHLRNTLPSSPLNAIATPIAAVTVDIDGNGRNATTPDIGADEFTPDACVSNTGGTIVSSITSICVSATPVLSGSGYATGLGIAYQWESSPDNVTFTAIAGATNPAAYSPASPVTVTTYYRLKVTCAAGVPGYSNTVTATVNTPAITASTGASRCGIGSVTLNATASAGTQVSWFDDPVSGTALATNTTSFVTPSISTTTTFYAQALTTPTLGTVGPTDPVAHGGTIGTGFFPRFMYFDVYQNTTLNSVDIYPVNAGEAFNVQLLNAGGTVLQTFSGTTSVSGGITPQTLTLNWPIPIGTGFQITSSVMPASGLTRNTSGSLFPYTSPVIDITGSDILPWYMFYYNWQYSSSCGSSPRTAVVATVTAPPALTTLNASAPTICEGQTTTLNANTTPAGTYTTYTWNPGALSGTSVSATPASTTTYTVIASNATCATSGQVTVTVNPVPSAITVTANPGTTVCAGNSATLTASGGTGAFFSETFEVFPLTKFTETGTGVTINQNTTYYQQGVSSTRLSIGINANGSMEATSDVNLSSFNNPTLTFYHICATEGGFDYGFAEYSTDGGGTWTSFPTTSYMGSGALKNGVVSFDKTSYADWSTQFTTSGSTPGTAPATALWKLETIDLSAWAASPQFRVRFRLTEDGSVIYYGWLIDNVKISGQAPITWLPISDLYTDAGTTAPYGAGQNYAVLYTKPTANRTYNVSATVGTCSSTASVAIAYTSSPISISIAATPGTTVCGGDTVKFTIASQNTQSAASVIYDWKVNGATLTGSATGASSSGTTVTVTSTGNLYVGMKVTKGALGAGAFAADTRIVSILNSTQFTVSTAPILALSGGADIVATANGKTVTSIDIWSLANGDVVTCTLQTGGVSCVVPITGSVTSNTVGPFTVNANTPSSVSIAPGPTATICAGVATTFTATPVNGGAAPLYEWFVNGVSQGVPALSSTFTSSTLTNGQVVTCRMTSNASNCPLPLKPISAGTTVTVNPSFPVSVALSANPGTSVCAGPVLFTAIPTNGGGAPLYEFLVNGISQGAASSVNTFNLLSVTDLDLVEVILTSSIASCALNNPDTAALTMHITPLTVSVHLTPATPICAGIPRTYTATPTNGGGSPLFQFFVNNISQGAASTTATLTYTPVNGDVIKVEVQSDLGGCALPNPADTFFTQVVNANPTATISSSGTAVCTSAPVLFTASATAGGSATISTYQWVETAPLLNVGTNTGTYVSSAISKSYYLTVTNSLGCSVTSNTIGPLTDGTLGTMGGAYTIGTVNATASGASAGTTINVVSTAGLIVGQAVAVTSGSATGVFAAGTTITSITNATQFVVSAVPTTALTAGATITGATCSNYISFASAIAALNSRSIGANCVFSIPPSYVENISAQLALGAATLNTASNTWTITFQKNGAGVNPKINAAFVGVSTAASAAPDGIWSLNGINNVTIDGIDLNDNNSTNPASMEFGYGLFKLSNTDGAQGNTIKNCTVTLNRVNIAAGGAVFPAGSTAIIAANSTRVAANTALTAGAAVGANSNNKFYTNTLQNCNNGIALIGFAAGGLNVDADVNNDIGGALNATGNNILNFGGGAGATLGASGIIANNEWGVNISYNTVNNNNGSGVNHISTLKGIYGQAGVSASATINNNTISVFGGGTTATVTGIDNTIGATAAANTVSINNNVVTGSYTTATTGTWTGISNTSNAATVNLNANTIQNVTLPGNGSNTFTGITSTGAFASGSTLRINNNSVLNNTKTNVATGAAVLNNMSLIVITGPVAGAIVETKTNILTGNTITGGNLTATLLGISMGGAGTVTASDNIISTNSITAMSSTPIATIQGYSNGSTSPNETVTNNIINNLFITGSGSTGLHVINGIRNNTVTTAVRSVSNNTIYNLYAGSGLSSVISGIISSSGATVTLSKNKIYNLFPGQSATAGSIAKGISITAGTTVNASNNMISIDLSLAAAATSSVAANSVLTGADAVRGIEMTSALASGTMNLYYNSIRLAGNGGAGFGSSGIFHTINTTATTAVLNLRNNIIDNECTPNGGLVVAYRRSAGAVNNLANYASTSNNNLFYAGTPGANNLIYSDGTSSAQTITLYKAGAFTAGTINPRDQASVSDKPNFTSSTDLHLVLDNNCIANGLGAVIPGFTDDYDGDTRNAATPDLGFDEFAGTNPVSLTVTNPAGVCSGFTVDLTGVTTGSSGGTTFYYYTDAGGTTTLATPAAVGTAGTYYIKYGKGSCYSAITPVVVTINPNNTWLGINTNWNDAQNWCPGVPGAATDVTIPAAVANYPVIISGATANARNVTIAAGASVTTTGTGILDVKGNLVNNGTLANWGEIRMTGTVAQTLPGTGTVAAMNKLTIANTSGANPAVTINNNLLIREVITPTTGIINLNNSFVTLRSTVDSTARVGAVGTDSFTYTGTGNFVVERYYPGRRTWRLITAPIIKTTARSIFSSWQVGGNTSLTGSGTFVSGIGANPATNGLDITATSSSSLKVFNYVNSALNAVLNTKTSRVAGFTAVVSALADTTGYFMFIRGDRTAANVNAFNPSGSVLETTLRDTGNIITGAYTFTCNPNTGANKYTLIGNPYASPVDFAGLTRSNLLDRFWAWDPNLNAVGGYVILDGAGYVPVKSPLTSTGTVGQTQIIQSSQAVLVETIAAGPASLTFNESNKSATNNLSVFRPIANPVTTMASNIFIIGADGAKVLADGAVTQFADEYNGAIDRLDAAKFSNINENFGIVSNGTTLSIERRKTPAENDTLFYTFTKTGQKNYMFNVYMQNFVMDNNLTPFLEDTYLKKLTSVNTDGDTWVDFSVTADAASADRNRFRIIFKKLVQYTGIGAEVLNSDVAVNWNVSSEFNIDHYEVERSENGTSFETVGTQLSSGNSASGKNYSLLDLNPAPGVYYYRIKCIGNNGAIAYSDKAKVTVIKGSPAMFVFPNPVTNNVIGLQMNKMQGGVYETILMSEDGKVINRNRIVHANGTATESIKPALNLISGSYRLEVVGPDKKVTTLNIIVQTK
jgi:hypothetical protein